jgi:uncharacterized phiE125 gp8 family phage protein
MSESLVTVVPASEAPISLDEAKRYLRILNTSEDGYISHLLEYIAPLVEARTSRAFKQTEYRWKIDCWETILDLPRAPLVSVTHVKYVDTVGAQQTMPAGDYVVDIDSQPGRVYPTYNTPWPFVLEGYPRVIEVQFIAGYTNARMAPHQHAVLMLLSHLFERHEPFDVMELYQIPEGFWNIIDDHRVRFFR